MLHRKITAGYYSTVGSRKKISTDPAVACSSCYRVFSVFLSDPFIPMAAPELYARFFSASEAVTDIVKQSCPFYHVSEGFSGSGKRSVFISSPSVRKRRMEGLIHWRKPEVRSPGH